MKSLYDYLIDYSEIDIDKSFIKEFYLIQMNPGKFSVDFDLVIKWLGVVSVVKKLTSIDKG